MDLILKVTGTVPLIMHNAQLSDPLNQFSKALKELTSKRIKTDDDLAEMAKREWLGGLYYDNELGPYIPGPNIQRSLLDAARMHKRGKSVERGVFVTTNENALMYAGSRSAGVLVEDENFRLRASVKVGQQRVMRCRPMFRDWSLTAEIYVDETQLDLADFRSIADNAGKFIGLGDWRPTYGRFVAQVEVA